MGGSDGNGILGNKHETKEEVASSVAMDTNSSVPLAMDGRVSFTPWTSISMDNGSAVWVPVILTACNPDNQH